jgi:tryptophan synthase alpha chain
MLTFRSKPGLVVYVTCGDPDLATSKAVILAAIDAGADVIELGVPFSDPVADGPVIQRASERALKSGTNLRDVLELGAQIRKARLGAGLIIFSYLNPIVRYGVEKFVRAMKDAGIDGALVTDLTIEEAEDYREQMRANHLAPIFLAAPTSPDSRLKKIAQASSGFIYAVSRTGVTGAKSQNDVRGDAEQLVKRIKKFSRLPVAVGFGISNAQDFQQVGKFADAAVIGSAIVKIIEDESAKKSGPEKTAAAVAEFINRVVGSFNHKAFSR